MCPAVKNSDDKRKLACAQKDQCKFAHNVFEEYLHPDRCAHDYMFSSLTLHFKLQLVSFASVKTVICKVLARLEIQDTAFY